MAGNNSEQVTGRFTRLLKIGSPLWSEHGLPILLYLALTILFTWPMVPRFTTHIIGSNYDAYNGLWVMWHTKEALLGHQPLFDLPILYYPEGATLLTHVPGPVTGLFALPFWPWGAEAAHNGAVLIHVLHPFGHNIDGDIIYDVFDGGRGMGFISLVCFWLRLA
jgi:hypothetical protein